MPLLPALLPLLSLALLHLAEWLLHGRAAALPQEAVGGDEGLRALRDLQPRLLVAPHLHSE